MKLKERVEQSQRDKPVIEALHIKRINDSDASLHSEYERLLAEYTEDLQYAKQIAEQAVSDVSPMMKVFQTRLAGKYPIILPSESLKYFDTGPRIERGSGGVEHIEWGSFKDRFGYFKSQLIWGNIYPEKLYNSPDGKLMALADYSRIAVDISLDGTNSLVFGVLTFMGAKQVALSLPEWQNKPQVVRGALEELFSHPEVRKFDKEWGPVGYDNPFSAGVPISGR